MTGAAVRSRTALRATRRCAYLFLAGLPVALLPALVSPAWTSLWLAWVGLSAAAVGIDATACVRARAVRASLAAPAVLPVGQAEPMAVRVSLAGAGPPLRVGVLLDLAAPLAPEPLRTLAVPRGGTATAEVPLRSARRGTVRIETLWLRWEGPLGLVRREVRLPQDVTVRVIPDVRAVRTAAARFLSSREFVAGMKLDRGLGAGSEFASLREHVPGMDPRAIHWKASARHRRLLSQEFRAERNHQVVVAVDTGRLLQEPLGGIPRLDHALSGALLLAYVSLRAGDRVGLFAFDDRVRSYVEPQGGLRAFPRLQAACAGLDYSSVETHFALGLSELSARLRRRSLVVLFTDFVDTVTAELMVDDLARLSRRHLVLFVALRDPDLDRTAAAPPDTLDALHRAVVAGDLARERDAVLRRIRRLGAHVIDASPERASPRLVERYLDLRRREVV